MMGQLVGLLVQFSISKHLAVRRYCLRVWRGCRLRGDQLRDTSIARIEGLSCAARGNRRQFERLPEIRFRKA